ncbi:gamma carbonic anhydrase family protein [Halobacteriovorax marinus]|uniref:gamma carbonic anhydrase family protein n=1 Tax=Halobacteriovorax marinus TaxID=97084 RepID=UPI000BC2FB5C|nr:gamma carbonic anhydrase family protein [Halobacteriovorax marinus]ATH09575.1 gamma carbonic anhydrase family protein [Halobacteriovorax marinus]
MPIYKFENITPTISNECFIAPSADVIGKVWIGEKSSIWFRTVVRGDVQEIHIGKSTNIQDLCMLHVTEELPLIIGNGVSVGHSVTLHACTIEDNCLIGMGSTILDGAVIGENSLVAAGSIVAPGKKYPPGSFIIGSPAIVKRQLNEGELKLYGDHYKSYEKYSKQFLDANCFEKVSD